MQEQRAAKQESLPLSGEFSPAPGIHSVRKAAGAGFSRDEMNLAEFPLTVLSTRSDPSIKTLEFTDYHRAKNGEMIERKWVITGADKFGLPTSTDDDVILGLIRLTMDDGFRQRKIYFTRYELLKTLRWTTEGRSYQRLVRSLDRLSGVRIRASNSFYDNSSKSYQTVNFGIVDSYEINDQRNSKELSNGEAPKSFFVWSEMLFDSFQAGFIKKIDLDLYLSLKSSVSRRLYRYLDKHFYFKNMIERPLLPLAFEKIGLSRKYRYVSSVRQQIEPAAEELKQAGFISNYEISGKGEGTVIRFFAAPQVVAGPSASRENRSAMLTETGSMDSAQIEPLMNNAQPPAASRIVTEADFAAESSARANATARNLNSSTLRPEVSAKNSLQNQLVEALVSRGLSVPQSKRLLVQRDERELGLIDEIIQYYDFLVDRNDSKISRNKLGFLYRAVESPHRFNIPANFRSKNEIIEAGAKPRRSSRPEHRPFRKGETSVSPAKNIRRSITPPALSDAELLQLRACIQRDVEKRLASLRAIFSPERFELAVENGVREELARAGYVTEV